MKQFIKLILGTMFLTFLTCKTTGYDKIKKYGTKNDARLNAIYDYSKSSKLVSNKFYIIDNHEESEHLYCFEFGKNEKQLMELTDSIGGFSTYSFPNNYYEIDKKLFLWYEPSSKITKELIDIMYKYNSIDSSYFKEPNYIPIINTGELKKGMFYFICKENISKYEKIKAIWLDKEDYPKVECSRE